MQENKKMREALKQKELKVDQDFVVLVRFLIAADTPL